MITDWTWRHDKHEAMSLIGGAGVPAGAVHDTMELMNEPSFTERGILQVAEHLTGPFKMPSWPVRFDGKTPKLAPAPLLAANFRKRRASALLCARAAAWKVSVGAASAGAWPASMVGKRW